MRSLSLGLLRMLILPLALVGASGCVVTDPGELMRFDITFERLGCHAARVDEVVLTFETGGLGTHSWVCSGAGGLSAWVGGVRPGTYRVRFEAFDQGHVVYSGRFDVRHVSGNTRPHDIDLRRTTEVIANFTFAGQGFADGLTCEQAKITRLDIEVGGLRYTGVPCRSGGRDAVALVGVEPGWVDIKVDAFDAQGRRLYASLFEDVEIYLGANEFDLNLLPLEPGGLEFEWRFAGNASCSQTGVQSVEYHLVGPDGSVEGGTQVEACISGGVRYEDLEPGLYTLVFISGKSGGNELYRATSVGLYVPAGRVQLFDVNLPKR